MPRVLIVDISEGLDMSVGGWTSVASVFLRIDETVVDVCLSDVFGR